MYYVKRIDQYKHIELDSFIFNELLALEDIIPPFSTDESKNENTIDSIMFFI